MDCDHAGFHTFSSEYDRRDGVLVYFRVCEGCGAHLNEALREPYRPNFDPDGNVRLQAVTNTRQTP